MINSEEVTCLKPDVLTGIEQVTDVITTLRKLRSRWPLLESVEAKNRVSQPTGVPVFPTLPTEPSRADATAVHYRDLLTKAHLEAWVIWMRQNGRTPAGNLYTCVFNSFCSWLNEQGPLKIKIKKLKSHSPPVTVFADTEVRQFMLSKPKRMTYQRTWILITVMLDT